MKEYLHKKRHVNPEEEMVDNKYINNGEDKLFWSYFINDKGEQEYYKLCEQCKNDCKQRYQICGIMCLKYNDK